MKMHIDHVQDMREREREREREDYNLYDIGAL